MTRLNNARAPHRRRFANDLRSNAPPNGTDVQDKSIDLTDSEIIVYLVGSNISGSLALLRRQLAHSFKFTSRFRIAFTKLILWRMLVFPSEPSTRLRPLLHLLKLYFQVDQAGQACFALVRRRLHPGYADCSLHHAQRIHFE